MKKFLRQIILLALPVLAMSCSKQDNPTKPTDCSIENSLMLRTGNYWIYDRYQVDSNEAYGQTEKNVLDSVVVEGTRMLMGRQAYIVVSYGSDGSRDTVYHVVNGNMALAALSFITDEKCQCIPARWVAFADCSVKNWTILDTLYNGDSFPTNINGEIVSSQTVKSYTVRGNSLPEETHQLQGRPVKAKPFHTTSLHKYSLVQPQPSPKNSQSDIYKTVESDCWLSEGIGAVRQERDILYRYDIGDSARSQFIINPSLGRTHITRSLLRYSVK